MSLFLLFRRRAIETNGIVTAEAFGSPAINLTIEAVGIVPEQSLGQALIDLDIGPVGIVSAEAFGKVMVDVSSAAIPRGGYIGGYRTAPRRREIAMSICPVGIKGEEEVGIPEVVLCIAATGIETREEFGQAVVVTVPVLVPLYKKQRYEQDETIFLLLAA